MHFKYIFVVLIAMSAFILPDTLKASDFEWRLNLNLRSHSDPYGYRYGLVNRFGIMESDVILILNRVYEPADAYMILRLAEISGLSPEYVLQVYYDRRQNGWYDIALYLGIRSDMHDFIILRERHDMRDIYYEYNNRRKERYEERYIPSHPQRYVPIPPKHYTPPQKHYVPEPQRHEQPRHESNPPVQERNKVNNKEERHEPKKYEPQRKVEPQHPSERDEDNRRRH